MSKGPWLQYMDSRPSWFPSSCLIIRGSPGSRFVRRADVRRFVDLPLRSGGGEGEEGGGGGGGREGGVGGGGGGGGGGGTTSRPGS